MGVLLTYGNEQRPHPGSPAAIRPSPCRGGKRKASHPPRRRRHWRPPVSGRGAGARAATARACRRARHRPSRRAFQVSRPRRASHPERDLARPQSTRAGAHRGDAGARHRRGLGADREHPPRRGGRFRRLSDRAAIVGGELTLRADRAHEQNGVMGRATACWRRATAIATSSARWRSSIRACKARSASPAIRCARR